jgi:hypothetical protein
LSSALVVASTNSGEHPERRDLGVAEDPAVLGAEGGQLDGPGSVVEDGLLVEVGDRGLELVAGIRQVAAVDRVDVDGGDE